ncbi:MAG: hypothetical protein C4519_12380 [Desulfobacteraceae bacterium]|nr:MAG: hypothetical protein C4519_12380 [Desulfobacteraceae bacterium]
MKAKGIWLLLILTSVTISTPLCWAKETCYNYIIAYSYRDLAVYHTPVFTAKTKGVSYNTEEYVADTATSIKMETAFQKYLGQKVDVKSADLTVSARVAYKTEGIAKNRMDKEVDDFRFRGFAIKEVPEFKYND